jgi:phage gpG-like protein
MAFRGEFAKLGQLAKNLGELASVPSKIASEVAQGIEALIKAQFRNEMDPYGKSWEPLADSTLERPRIGGILMRTGRGFASISVKPLRGAGLQITLEDYFGFHQAGFHHIGGVKVPARPVLPGGRFPKSWSDEIEHVGELAIRKKLGRVA